MTWRYLGFSEPDGAYLGEVDLGGVELTTTLSGAGQLAGIIPAGSAPLWLKPWQCSIYAEDESGTIRAGGFVTPLVIMGDRVQVDCVGRAGYPVAMPWTGEPFAGVQVDPLDMFRLIWSHLQSQPGGDVRAAIDTTTSPVRIGTPLEEVSFTTGAGELVEFEAGPFNLNWWSTTDLGSVIDDLASSTPFDFRERVAWAESGLTLEHRIELGYPTLGARRHDVRLALGENVVAIPELVGDIDSYLTEVNALGAGEGRSMVRVPLSRTVPGVRRAGTFVDKGAQNKTDLAVTARRELGWRDGSSRVTEFEVIDTEAVPLSTLTVGDEVLLVGGDGAGTLDRWVRITGITEWPDTARARINVWEVVE